jgi:Ca2+-binding EF-hand superfamily protein
MGSHFLEMLMNVRILTAALLVASTAALAVSPDTSAPAPGRQTLDQNGDGTISREEAAAHPRLAQSFDRLDTNKDGVLSREELRAGRPSGHHGRHANLDTNGDGSISRDEARAATRLAERFDAIDVNKDGLLTREELAAWRRTHPRPTPDSSSEPVKP